MIEHIKKNWKVIVIFVLVAIIAFMLYQRGKEDISQPLQPAKGKAGEMEEVVEAVEVVEKEPQINFDTIFEDYRAGKISQKEAQIESGLATGTFYRKLKKYDDRKTDAV